MTATTISSTAHTSWTKDRIVYWSIGIALVIVIAIAFTRDRMVANNNTSSMPYSKSYDAGVVTVPTDANELELSGVNDADVAPGALPDIPHIDTPTSGAIQRVPLFNQSVIPSADDVVREQNRILPQAKPQVNGEATVNSRMNRSNGLDAQDRIRGSGTTRQQSSEDQNILNKSSQKSVDTLKN